MAYTDIVTSWTGVSNSTFQVAVTGTNFDITGDIAANADLTQDTLKNALYSRFDTTTGMRYLMLRASVNSNFSQKLIINFDVDAGSGLDSKIDFAIVADLGALPNSYTSGTPVADGIYVTGSQSGSLNTRPNNTDFYLAATQSVQTAMTIADSAIAMTTIGSDTYVDLIINFNRLFALLQDATTADGDAQVVTSPYPYPTFNENTPIRFALTSSANLNNVNKDISGTATNDLSLLWADYLSPIVSVANLVGDPPSITSIAEVSGNGINATEAANGTPVVVSLAGTKAIAGDILTIAWGSQTVDYTLTATDITNQTATVTIPANTLTTQGSGTITVTAHIGTGSTSFPTQVIVDLTVPSDPTISSIPESTNGLNAAEASDGTPVTISLAGTEAVAGDSLALQWGGQPINPYTLTQNDITAGTVTLTVPSAAIAAQGEGSVNITATLTDQSGNVGTASAPIAVVVDRTLPTLSSSAITGDALTLTYSEPLNAGNVPDLSAYTVQVNGNSVPVSAIALNGSTLTLTLATPVEPTDSVTLAYTVPGSNPIQDTAGNQAAALNQQGVTNNTSDTTNPSLTELTPSVPIINDGVSTFTLTTVYDEAMNTLITPVFSFPVIGENPGAALVPSSGQWLNSTTYVTTFSTTDTNQTIPAIDVRVTGAQDSAGNSQGATDFTNVFTLDTTNPTVTLTSTAPSVVNGPFTVIATFSHPMTGLTADDIQISNGVMIADPVSLDGGKTYQFSVRPLENGSISLTVGSNAGLGSNGNGNVATLNSLVYTAAVSDLPSTNEGIPLPAAPGRTIVEECDLGIATPAIDLTSGKRGIRRAGSRTNNHLKGLKQNDILKGRNGNDRLRGKRGKDRVDGGNGRDRLIGNGGNDQLLGQRSKDRLLGKTGRDWMDGGSGNDRLTGGKGDDVLVGGLGRDRLVGGTGTDMFVYQSLEQGGDRITDFNTQTDLLDLRGILSQPNFVGGDVHDVHTQLIQAVQIGRDTQILIDADGLGAGTTFVTLVTLQNVAAPSLDCHNLVLK